MTISGDVQGVRYRACLAKRDPAPQEVEKMEAVWEKSMDEFVGFEVVY